MSEVDLDPETEAQITAAIHEMDARGYSGPLLISKIAKEFNFEVELVAEVVERLINRGIAVRYASHHKDQFKLLGDEPPRNYLGRG